MKHIVLIITMVFLAGFFTAGQALASSHQKMEKSEMPTMGEDYRMNKLSHQQLNRNQVREMQSLLNEHGFNAGQPDGILGPNTRDALRKFQESEGLTTTGAPDRETLKALAPGAEKQEFFGLSPEYGEKGQHPMKPEGDHMKSGGSTY